MKKCPFCSWEIQDVAIKCKFCKTFLNDESKEFLNKVLNEAIIKTSNNPHLKKVHLSKSVFEVMKIWEILYINEIIKRIINWLNNNLFYINLEKTDVDRIAVIVSYLSWENQPYQSKVAECFEKLWNWNFKMIKNPYFIQEENDEIEDKNQEKNIKEIKKTRKNFIEKLFFSWFFRPKFIDIKNINQTKLGRFFIVLYMFSFLILLFLAWIFIYNELDFDEYLILFFLFYIFMTLILSFFYKLYLYVKKW